MSEESTNDVTFEGFPAALSAEFGELVGRYPDAKAALIPMLHRCQEELGGWLSPEILEACAERLGMEPVEVYGVASFYPMFHLKPRGTHLVSVCHNISCDLRGARDILDKAREVTGCPKGARTSADGRFTVQAVECQGACASAPMIDLDGVYHENLTVEDVARILEEVR